MLMHKQPHGSGEDLDFPDADQIKEAMKGHGPKHLVPIFGDGSHTTPTKWRAAFGGYGVWVPSWNRNVEVIEAREEKNDSGGAIGQTGSSTRQELIVWILVLSLPIRGMYATDRASMLAKAKKLIEAAKAKEDLEAHGKKSQTRNPFRKPLGLQEDGELWEQA